MPTQLVGDGMIEGNCHIQCQIMGRVFGGATRCVWGSTVIASRTAIAPAHGAFCTAHENVHPNEPWTLMPLGDQADMGTCQGVCGAEARRRGQAVLCTFGSTSFTVSGP